MSSDPFAGFTQDPSSGLMVPIITNSPIPWQDLGSRPLPVEQPQMGNTLLPVVAAAAYQGPHMPVLGRANPKGAQHVEANVAISALAARPQIIGDTVLSVDDPSFVATRPWFHILQQPSAGGVDHGPYFGFPGADAFSFTLGTPLVKPVTIGDVIIAVPYVMTAGNGSATSVTGTVDVTDRAGRVVGQCTIVTDNSFGAWGASSSGQRDITAVVDNLNQVHLEVVAHGYPTIGFANTHFGAPSTPSITLPLIAGQSITIHSWSTCVANFGGGVATTPVITIASGVQQMWSESFGCTAVQGNVGRTGYTDHRLVGQKGQTVTLSWNIPIPANVSGDISVTFTYK